MAAKKYFYNYIFWMIVAPDKELLHFTHSTRRRDSQKAFVNMQDSKHMWAYYYNLGYRCHKGRYRWLKKVK